MGQEDVPPDVHIQHDPPPIFYCWKYWVQTGEYHEGCTDVKASPQNFPDLNDFGWVYIVIPVAALFLLIFVFYCCCRGKSGPVKSQLLMSEESDSDDEEVFPQRTKSSAAYRGVPVRSSDARNYYTVVPIDPHDPQKMPLQGGIDASHPGYIPQQRLYPRLTAMRQQAGSHGQATRNGQVKTADISPPEAASKSEKTKSSSTKQNKMSSTSSETSDEE